MHIKKILTPILLLSFATGLYNPIKAAVSSQKEDTQKQETAIRIHVLFPPTLEEEKSNEEYQQKTVGITVATLHEDSIMTIKYPSKVVSDLLDAINSDDGQNSSDRNRVKECSILVELPHGYIKEAFLNSAVRSALSCFQDLNSGEAKLVITGDATEDEKKASLAGLEQNIEGQFFTTAWADDKKICAKSLEAALADDNNLPNRTEIGKITAQLSEFKQGHDDKQLQLDSNANNDANRGQLVLVFSQEYYRCIFESADQKHNKVVMNFDQPEDISKFIAFLEEDKRQICGIGLYFRGDEAKEVKFLARFIDVFGARTYDDNYLIRLMIKMDIDKVAEASFKNRVKDDLYSRIDQKALKHNAFFENENNNGNKIELAGEDKVTWVTTNVPALTENAKVISHDIIDKAIQVIQQKEETSGWKLGHIVGVFLMMAAVGGGLYWIYKQYFSPKAAEVDKKSEDATQATDTEVEAKSNPAEESQVPDTASTPASADDTSVPASNSGNHAGWGFQAWVLLIMAMILIVGGGYWYMRREKED